MSWRPATHEAAPACHPFGAALLLGPPTALIVTALHIPLMDRFIRREEKQLEIASMGLKHFVQPLLYSSWRRHQTPVSLRPVGARSSHWYMPQRPSSPRAYVE
jgi:hypothetical protein